MKYIHFSIFFLFTINLMTHYVLHSEYNMEIKLDVLVMSLLQSVRFEYLINVKMLAKYFLSCSIGSNEMC